MMFDNRYLSAEKLVAYLDELSTPFNKTEIGRSVQNRPINALKLGAGPIRVLMWSQMHGNEATTTRTLIDLFDYLQHKGAFLLDA
ncbi:MAG: M14 family zinc carboxypeptidase, partial [Flavobacteriaceae bacterium]